jgi:hypothetical protein
MIEVAIIIMSVITKFDLNNDSFLNQYFQLELIKHLNLQINIVTTFIMLNLKEEQHYYHLSCRLNKPFILLQSFKGYYFYLKNYYLS